MPGILCDFGGFVLGTIDLEPGSDSFVEFFDPLQVSIFWQNILR